MVAVSDSSLAGLLSLTKPALLTRQDELCPAPTLLNTDGTCGSPPLVTQGFGLNAQCDQDIPSPGPWGPIPRAAGKSETWALTKRSLR